MRFLARPRPYREVEDLEQALLSLWRDVLGGPANDLGDLEACSAFFSRVGFFHKYKTYGVKVALPFGYSLFDLAPGRGFSFQVHEEPKLEGFHVLRPKTGAFLYVADLDEWESGGRAWAKTRLGRPGDEGRLPTGGLVPLEGDVASVSETNIVHTVLGCVLEEYASCSVDSVVRLHDQNDRSDPSLPHRHRPPVELLRAGSTRLPRRHLARCGDGWVRRNPPWHGEVLETAQVRGWREVLRPGAAHALVPGPHVTSVVVVTGRVSVSLSRSLLTRAPGEVVIVPPGLPVTLACDVPTTVSVHQVPSDLATYAWSR
ncbi:hypothetical protein [Oryzobacter terrae]|uniref:hypothetical protein n=1 Tax=Oryzobacter terrae TaxID=1620385 RepID=UPI00366FEDE0